MPKINSKVNSKKGKSKEQSLKRLKDQLVLARSSGNSTLVKALEKILKRLESSH